jgi:hypothetical protein
MNTALSPQKWDGPKIDRKELSKLLQSVGLSISDYPSEYNQELYRLAEILVELAFYNLNEK